MNRQATARPLSAPPTSPAVRRNRAVAALFALLGAAILVAAWQLPPGIGNLPGPGFFPAVLGLLILGFAASLGFERAPLAVVEPETAAPPTDWKLALATVLLLITFVSAWSVLAFSLRTPPLVLLLMRFSGASWRGAILAAIAFPLFLYAVFQLGLRVDLN